MIYLCFQWIWLWNWLKALWQNLCENWLANWRKLFFFLAHLVGKSEYCEWFRCEECFLRGFALWIRIFSGKRAEMRVYFNSCHDKGKWSGRKMCFFRKYENHHRWKVIRCKGERRKVSRRIASNIYLGFRWMTISKQKARGFVTSMVKCWRTNLILICERTICFFLQISTSCLGFLPSWNDFFWWMMSGTELFESLNWKLDRWKYWT